METLEIKRGVKSVWTHMLLHLAFLISHNEAAPVAVSEPSLGVGLLCEKS